MNLAESAALKMAALEQGWEETENSNDADLILLNTCSVRLTAETRVMGRFAHYAALKKKGKAFTLVAAGYMAQRKCGSLKTEIPAVDYILGTSGRSFFPQILKAAEQGQIAEETEEKPKFAFSSSHLEQGSYRSFIPILHGCNNFCSYCIVPYVRGREISRDPLDIIAEIHLVAEKGVREITLLGQNVNSYYW